MCKTVIMVNVNNFYASYSRVYIGNENNAKDNSASRRCASTNGTGRLVISEGDSGT